MRITTRVTLSFRLSDATKVRSYWELFFFTGPTKEGRCNINKKAGEHDAKEREREKKEINNKIKNKKH